MPSDRTNNNWISCPTANSHSLKRLYRLLPTFYRIDFSYNFFFVSCFRLLWCDFIKYIQNGRHIFVFVASIKTFFFKNDLVCGSFDHNFMCSVYALARYSKWIKFNLCVRLFSFIFILLVEGKLNKRTFFNRPFITVCLYNRNWCTHYGYVYLYVHSNKYHIFIQKHLKRWWLEW